VLNAQVANLAAMAVDDYVARTILAAQQFVVGLLDSGLSHHVAGLVVRVARIVEVVFAHLADIPNQMRSKAIARIQPPLHVDGFQLRQFVFVRSDKCALVVCYFLLMGIGWYPGEAR